MSRADDASVTPGAVSQAPPPPRAMSSTRAAMIVTAATLSGQALGFVTSIVTAALFGAGSDMDAFFAVNVLPQFFVTSILGSLTVVFIPAFAELTERGKRDEAWRLASNFFNLGFLLFFAFSSVSMLMPRLMLALLAPGLGEAATATAVELALITWPTILAGGMITLVTCIAHAERRFTPPAMAPVIGGAAYLILLLLLGRSHGIHGLAWAATIGVFLQFLLLVPMLRGGWRAVCSPFDAAFVKLLLLALPLFASKLCMSLVPLVERLVASYLEEGSISHLGYAMKILTVGSLVISGGIGTVLFPRMAAERARGDDVTFSKSISQGLRIICFFTAPAVFIGIALAPAAVELLYMRGAFSQSSAAEVAAILRIYLVALFGMTLGEITSRSLYVLKETKIIAAATVIEALLYIVYVRLFANAWGARGVALGFVILYCASLVWQGVLIKMRVRDFAAAPVIGSFTKSISAAALSGLAALAVMRGLSPLSGIGAGAAAGIAAYLVTLLALGSRELEEMRARAVDYVYGKGRA